MPWFCPACRAELRNLGDAPTDKEQRAFRCDMCRLELVFDGISGRMRLPADDEQMIVRPDYDRRKAGQDGPTATRDRRRTDRRRRVTIH